MLFVIKKQIYKRARVIKFLISGTISTSVNLFLVFLFHGVLSINIVLSSTLAFLLAFFVSFTLQKFWTFKNREIDLIHKQLFHYLLVSLTALVVNGLLMYLFVEVFHVWYLSAQFMTSALIASVNFFVYKLIIFK